MNALEAQKAVLEMKVINIAILIKSEISELEMSDIDDIKLDMRQAYQELISDSNIELIPAEKQREIELAIHNKTNDVNKHHMVLIKAALLDGSEIII